MDCLPRGPGHSRGPGAQVIMAAMPLVIQPWLAEAGIPGGSTEFDQQFAMCVTCLARSALIVRKKPREPPFHLGGKGTRSHQAVCGAVRRSREERGRLASRPSPPPPPGGPGK